MKRWTEGDVLHLLSAGDVGNISKLCMILDAAGSFDGSGPGLVSSEGDKLRSMVVGMKKGGFPKFTAKQASFAASMLRYKRNEHMIEVAVRVLNDLEAAGTPAKFTDNLRPDRGDEPKFDVKLAAAKARELASVSTDTSPATAEVNPNWGMF